MRQLIINNQTISQPSATDTPYSACNCHRFPTDGCNGNIRIDNFVGNINIKPHDADGITITTTNPHVACFYENMAATTCISGPNIPLPSAEDRITFPHTISPTDLTIYIANDAPDTPAIYLNRVSGKVTLCQITCDLNLRDSPACELSTPGTSIQNLSVDLTGNAKLEISHITGNVNISAHDDANILISSGEIKTLQLSLYGSAYTLIKVPVTQKAILENAGVHNIHLDKVIGNITPILAGSGSIIIDHHETPEST